MYVTDFSVPRAIAIGCLTAIACGAGSAARAQTCTGVTPSVRSLSTAEAGPLTMSGPFFGHPAITDVTNDVVQLPGRIYSARAALTIDQSYFTTVADVGGVMQITGGASNSASARATGDVTDCIQIDGYGGSGRSSDRV